MATGWFQVQRRFSIDGQAGSVLNTLGVPSLVELHAFGLNKVKTESTIVSPVQIEKKKDALSYSTRKGVTD